MPGQEVVEQPQANIGNKETSPMSRKWQERGSRRKLQRTPHGEKSRPDTGAGPIEHKASLVVPAQGRVTFSLTSAHLSLPRRHKKLANNQVGAGEEKS